MHILHVYKDYPPVIGGIENHVKLLAEELAAQGLEVTVLVTSASHRTKVEEMNGVRVIRAARMVKVGSTPLSAQLLLWLRRLSPDISHLHFPYPPGEVGQFFWGRSRKLIITYHSDVIRQRVMLWLYRRLLLRILGKTDRIIVTSPNYIESSRYLQSVSKKCEVIPLGIDWRPFRRVNEEETKTLRERYGTPLLLFVGRLRYYKGLDFLLQAVVSIPVNLVIVGTGPEEASCRALARQLGISHRVFFAGDVTQQDLPSYYRACDLFVLPASHRSEAFGLVQLEAMAAGVPVICTELRTGTSFVNRDGQTGLVVPPRDPDALCGAIQQLLSDPERRKQMGRAGTLRVQSEFSKERMCQRTVELYRSLMAEQPGDELPQG